MNTAREATALDVRGVLEIAQAAQDKLTQAGRAQQIAGYTRHNMDIRIHRRELFVLERANGLLGSAFVEPVTPERFPQIGGWKVAPAGSPVWFLYGLVIAPDWQGQGWGRVLLNGICRRPAFAPRAVLILDCWAGNQKLRCFYSEAGFQQHGEFPENDYHVAVFRRA